MLLQYHGREQELLATLRIMQEKNNLTFSPNDDSVAVFGNNQEDSTITSNASGVRRSSIGSDD
jgi:hypothetical protein